MKKIKIISFLLIFLMSLGIVSSCNGTTSSSISQDSISESGDSTVLEDIGTEGLEFFPINDEECAVAAGKANLLKEIIIPSKHENYKVTSIYSVANSKGFEGGFANCTNLEKITIPDSITSIGNSAFSGCSSLENIVIPNSVTTIGINAFGECTSLKSITLPFVGQNVDGSGKTHFGYVFGADFYNYNNDYVPSSLKEVIITGGTNIAWGSFINCKSLVSIKILDSIKVIACNAFVECDSLKSVVIPNTVTNIGAYAFKGCECLTIYCELESRPDGWDYNWCKYIDVYWAGQWEYDEQGNPTPIV